MTKVARRGFDEADKRWFSKEALIMLRKANEEIKWLLDRGYKLEPIVTFVGDRYQFSTRQRDELKRGTCSTENENNRKAKELSMEALSGSTISIDGFNLIITLEVALSGGALIVGNDGNIRDLAGLRGTYKLIDKTDIAIKLIGEFLSRKKVREVRFYLDAPVSNSGNLKAKIFEYAKSWLFNTNVELVNNADVILEGLENVVSSDAAVIDKSKSYINLAKRIIDESIDDAVIINIIG